MFCYHVHRRLRRQWLQRTRYSSKRRSRAGEYIKTEFFLTLICGIDPVLTLPFFTCSRLIYDGTAKAPPSAADDKNKSAAPAGIAQAISGYQDSNLVWEDINFIRVSCEFYVPRPLPGEKVMGLMLCNPWIARTETYQTTDHREG